MKTIINMKSQKGAVSAIVLITVLTFVLVLLGAIITVTTLRKSQLRSDIRIQDIYSKDVDNVNGIYENLIENRTMVNELRKENEASIMTNEMVNEIVNPITNEITVNSID